MIQKTIEVDGMQVRFCASASIPRIYRIRFRRDIMQDMQRLRTAYLRVIREKACEQNDQEAIQERGFEILDLEIFENIAYIMARHAAPESVPPTVEEWLDQFNMFSIYVVLPQILELWGLNEESLVESKKKLAEVAGN